MSKKTVMMILRFMMIGGIIFTIVFYSARIFAHCEEPSLGASSGGSGNDSYYPFASDVPLKVGSDMGFPSEISMSDSLMQSIIDDINSGNYPGYNFATNSGFNNVNLALFREFSSGSNQVSFYVFKDGYIDSFDFPSDFSQNSLFCNFRSLNNYYLIVTYDLDDSAIVAVRSTTGNAPLTFYPLGNGSCWIDVVFYDPILGTTIYGLKTNKAITNYPVFLRDGELSFGGSVRFSTNVSSGGDSDINDEITDNIDDSFDLPQVDDSSPSDSTNIPSWLQKILTGLKTFNKNMLGIGRTIIGKLKDILDNLKDFIDKWVITFDDGINAIIQAINGLKDGTTQQQAKDAWIDGFNNWSLKPALDIVSGWGSGFHSSIDGASPLSDYSYTINMPPIGIPNVNTGQIEQVYLFGRSITIDLNWYVKPNFFGKSPRDYLTEFVIPWLILGFAVSLFFKLPGIIGGASDNMTMIKDLTTNNINSGKVGTYGGILSQTKIEPL